MSREAMSLAYVSFSCASPAIANVCEPNHVLFLRTHKVTANFSQCSPGPPLDPPTFPLHVVVMESGAAAKIPQETRKIKRSGLPTPTKEKQQNVISSLETNQGRFRWLLNGPRAIIIWWFILMSVAFVSYRVGVSVPC